MFAGIQRNAEGINRFEHNRTPARIDEQTVIRMNRDTLLQLRDCRHLRRRRRITVPDAGDRYLSVMIVNQDHYIKRVFHDAGNYDLTVARTSTRRPWRSSPAPWSIRDDPDDLAARRLGPGPAELTAVRTAQPSRQLADVRHGRAWTAPAQALLDAGLRHGLVRVQASDARQDVDPVHHLISTAAGWGGLPDAEATYVGRLARPARSEYVLTVR